MGGRGLCCPISGAGWEDSLEDMGEGALGAGAERRSPRWVEVCTKPAGVEEGGRGVAWVLGGVCLLTLW